MISINGFFKVQQTSKFLLPKVVNFGCTFWQNGSSWDFDQGVKRKICTLPTILWRLFLKFWVFLKFIPKKPESEKQGSRKNVLLPPYAITNQNRFIELFTIALSLICRINELSSSFHLFKKCTESWPNSCGNFPSPWSSRPFLGHNCDSRKERIEN